MNPAFSNEGEEGWSSWIPGYAWLEKIYRWLADLPAKLYDILRDFFWEIIGKGMEAALEILDWGTSLIADNMPSGMQGKIDAVADYYAVANSWLPLDYGITLLLAWMAVFGVCFLVRWIQEWIRNVIP